MLQSLSMKMHRIHSDDVKLNILLDKDKDKCPIYLTHFYFNVVYYYNKLCYVFYSYIIIIKDTYIKLNK